MNPQLSIIVPVYNVERYLRKCLESLLNQTFSDFEVICVNDGSTDGSLKILEEFEEKDYRIKVISQQNAGLGATRNVGIRESKGKYLGFIDSDDFADATLFEKAVKSAEENNSDVVIFNAYLYFTDSCYKTVFRDTEFYSRLEKEGYFSAVEHTKIINSIGVWDKLYRRDFIINNDIFNPEKRIYEDVVFTIKTLSMAKRISVIAEPLIYYRKNTGTSIVDKEIFTDYYKFDFLNNLKESKEFLSNIGLYTYFQKDFLFFQSQGILFHQNNMQTKKSYIQFEKSLYEILDFSDFEILQTFEVSGVHRGIKKYIEHIKCRKFFLQYFLFKFKRLSSVDPWYISVRLPKTTKIFKFKRLGYNKATRNENQKRIVEELCRMNHEIELLCETLIGGKNNE